MRVWLLHGQTWHKELVDAQVRHVSDALGQLGVEQVTAFAMPESAGVYELPQFFRRLLDTKPTNLWPNLVIALGVVVQGLTKHDDDVAGAAAQVLLKLGTEHRIWVLWGVVHAATLDAAKARVNAETCASYATLAQRLLNYTI
jgi:6,7-dimethyl-8-ribityllumazine synthase